MKNKILKWIFDNHQHHTGNAKTVFTFDSKITKEKDTSTCPDGNKPYVNSLELEKFIKKLFNETESYTPEQTERIK